MRRKCSLCRGWASRLVSDLPSRCGDSPASCRRCSFSSRCRSSSSGSRPAGPSTRSRRCRPQVLANLDAAYGLDQPLPVQYGRYLAGLVRGDLGPSFRYKDFTRHRADRDRPAGLSLTIGLAAALLAFFAGVPLGAWAAWRAGSLRRSRGDGVLAARHGAAGVRRRAGARAGVRHLLAGLPRRRIRARATRASSCCRSSRWRCR